MSQSAACILLVVWSSLVWMAVQWFRCRRALGGVKGEGESAGRFEYGKLGRGFLGAGEVLKAPKMSVHWSRRLALAFGSLYVNVFLLSVVLVGLFAASYGVVAMDEKYAINFIKGSQAIMDSSLAVTAAFAKIMAEAVGTDPEKNWIKLQRIMGVKFTDATRRDKATYLLFVLSSFSSNPKVWTRILDNKAKFPADFQQAATDVQSLYGTGQNSFLVWTVGSQGIPDADHFRTTQIPGSNPPLSLIAWLVANPNDHITQEKFMTLKVLPAMILDADCLEQCKWRQMRFMNTVLKKRTWEDKFFDTVAQSAYWWPGLFTGQVGARTMAAQNSTAATHLWIVQWMRQWTGMSAVELPEAAKVTAYVWNPSP